MLRCSKNPPPGSLYLYNHIHTYLPLHTQFREFQTIDLSTQFREFQTIDLKTCAPYGARVQCVHAEDNRGYFRLRYADTL